MWGCAMAETKKVIQSRTVISERGAVMKVTTIKLTRQGNQLLRADTKRGIALRDDKDEREDRQRAVPA
jgi:hypothetical protein